MKMKKLLAAALAATMVISSMVSTFVASAATTLYGSITASDATVEVGDTTVKVPVKISFTDADGNASATTSPHGMFTITIADATLTEVAVVDYDNANTKGEPTLADGSPALTKCVSIDTDGANLEKGIVLVESLTDDYAPIVTYIDVECTFTIPAAEYGKDLAVDISDIQATDLSESDWTGITAGGAKITVKEAAHVCTPAEAVVENNVDPTCTEAGSYDSVIYCSECGEEISRETITVEATDHTAAEAVVENNVDPTCTTAGSYDSVVYCSECGEEISRETIEVPAKKHTTQSSVVNYAMVTTCSECGETLASSLFSGVGLNITGSINLYLDGVYSGDYIKEYGFMVWKDTDSAGAKEDATILNEGTLYGTKYRFYFTDIKAKELADNVYVCPYVILEDDTFVQGYGTSYSVRKYCNNQYKSSSAAATLKNLCISLANYGAASQIAFDYRTDDLANNFLDSADVNYSYAGTPIDSFSMDNSNASTAATFNGMALNLVDVFRIRYDVNMKTDDINNTTLLVWSKEEYEALSEHTIDNASTVINMGESLVSSDANEDLDRKRQGCYVIETGSGKYSIYGQSIKAQEAENIFYSCLAVKQTDGSYKYSLTFTYGIETYCARILNKTVSSDDNTYNQCGALMNYYIATKAYFG